jgi:hypothetical protein
MGPKAQIIAFFIIITMEVVTMGRRKNCLAWDNFMVHDVR